MVIASLLHGLYTHCYIVTVVAVNMCRVVFNGWFFDIHTHTHTQLQKFMA